MKIFAESMTYDQHGRVFQHFDMTGSERGTQNAYNAHGYLDIVKEAYIDPIVGQVVYIDNVAMDALGNVTSKKLGNRTINRTYDQASGRLLSVGSVLASDWSTFDNLTLTYYTLGNLKSRHRASPGVEAKESYCYDSLNRLTKTHSGTLTGTCVGAPDTTYTASGNIATKSGQTYTYPTWLRGQSRFWLRGQG